MQYTTVESSFLPTSKNLNDQTNISKIIYFMHMHNSGGTTMCNIANKQKSLNPSKRNCNVFLKLKFNDANFGHAIPCCGDTIAEQANYAKTSTHKFIANEMYLPNELDYSNYDYITVLRDPWQRYLSHFAHDFPKQEKNFKSLTRYNKKSQDSIHKIFGDGDSLANDKFSVFLAKNYSQWVNSQRDNYYTRKLCGKNCMNVPRGKLNSTHLEKAKTRLNHFGAVLILENLSESLKIMEDKFGWRIPNKYSLDKYESNTNNEKVNHKPREGLPGMEIDKIQELTSFDDELYALAIYLNKNSC